LLPGWGDRLQTGKLSRYIINTTVNSVFHAFQVVNEVLASLAGVKLVYQFWVSANTVLHHARDIPKHFFILYIYHCCSCFCWCLWTFPDYIFW